MDNKSLAPQVFFISKLNDSTLYKIKKAGFITTVITAVYNLNQDKWLPVNPVYDYHVASDYIPKNCRPVFVLGVGKSRGTSDANKATHKKRTLDDLPPDRDWETLVLI